MGLLRKTFRLWWQKPRKISELEDERSVSFLELFYDLSYVVIVAELTHALVGHLSIENLLGFIGLFVMVWMAWVNGSYYHELHGNNDIRTRVFTFLQMFALAGMAIFAHNALAEGYQGFAASYSVFLLIVTYLWWRTGVHDKAHRSMSDPYALGFLVTTVLFVISIFTALSVSIYLWAAGILLSLFLPLILVRVRRDVDPKQVEGVQRMRPSIVERFGLLTIIVLGEVVVAVVQGAAQYDVVGAPLVVMILLGLSVAVGMWWVYFDYISHRIPIQKDTQRFSWIYLHLPLTMSIALAGVGALSALENIGTALGVFERWLLVAPVSAFLVCVVLLMQTIQVEKERREMYARGAKVALFAAIVILALGMLELSAAWLLLIVNFLLLAPIATALKLWIKRMRAQSQS